VSSRRDQQHVDRLRRVHEAECQAVARAEGDGTPGSQLGRDVTTEDIGDHLVGQQHENDVVARRGRERHDLEAVGAGALDILIVSIADPDLDARVAEVEGGATSEVAVPEDSDRLPLEGAWGHVLGAVQLHGTLSRSGHLVPVTGGQPVGNGHRL